MAGCHHLTLKASAASYLNKLREKEGQIHYKINVAPQLFAIHALTVKVKNAQQPKKPKRLHLFHGESD